MASSEGFAVTSYATPPAFAPAIELDDGHVVVRLARNALATRDAKRVDANSRVALRLRVAPGPGERGGGPCSAHALPCGGGRAIACALAVGELAHRQSDLQV